MDTPQERPAAAGGLNHAQDNHGAQITTLHGEVHIYQAAPGQQPQQQYNAGKFWLASGVPRQAEPLIAEAVRGGWLSAESCLHWVLSLLSGRSLDQLSVAEHARLCDAFTLGAGVQGGSWGPALGVVNRLARVLGSREAGGDAEELPEVLAGLDALPAGHRDLILRHLQVMLDGVDEDRHLAAAFDHILEQRFAGGRKDRASKYFEADPASPRARKPVPPQSSRYLGPAAWLGAALLGFGLFLAGLVLARDGQTKSLTALVLSAFGGYLFAWHGMTWRYCAERLALLERRYRKPSDRATRRAPADGFTSQVNQMFKYYTRRVLEDVPGCAEATAGIRRYLRDEILEQYRERRIPAARVRWLIRFRIRELRQQWQAGTLHAYRSRYQVPGATRLLCVTGGAALATGGLWSLVATLIADPVSGLAVMVLITAGALIGMRAGWRLFAEDHRSRDDAAEYAERMATAEGELRRWKARLADRPDDPEMAAWLHADKLALKRLAMQQHGLANRDVIGHPILEEAVRGCNKARVEGGPARYSVYKLIMLLLTSGGVWQVTAKLHFTTGELTVLTRREYRYDVVASVHVDVAGKEPSFRLRLINDEAIHVHVESFDADLAGEADTETSLYQLALDSSGISGVLHILEGVAAEGRDWIARRDERLRRRLAVAALPSMDLAARQ
ncbi:hypothetical protein [Longispora albida]|uniref:hypothetical protein n=1 Tax=Longispora albida TaxID=203523 RepID=UPI000375F0E1|nr:hypothetical protein [Longispora albida]